MLNKKEILISPKTDKAFSLWVLLQQTRDAGYNAREKELAKYGISSREAATLRGISALGETVTPARLARWAYRRPHTISGILKRMQKKGLVKLSKDPNIQNIIRVSLTEKGQEAYQAATRRESIHHIFETISEEQYDQLESILTEIRDNALTETGDTIHRPFP